MDDDPDYSVKDQVFTRYYFVDRGSEKELTPEEAREDFENFIFTPLRSYVSRSLVVRAVEAALKGVTPEGGSPDDLGPAELEKACMVLGVSFLQAYAEITDDEEA